MKKLLLILLLLTPVSAYLNASSMVINYGGVNTITVNHLTSRAKLINFSQELFLKPLRAEIINQSLNNLLLTNNSFLFTKSGDFTSASWSFNLTINNHRSIALLEGNPVFPQQTVSNDYLSFTDRIVYSPEIKRTADSVVKGVNDYLTAALLLTAWVHDNMVYTPTDYYFTANTDSAEILSELRGVCDEYAVLLISMLRAEGIESRYVSGYSYGNVLNNDGFGPHAWVEAMIPGYGWISLDPTYGEYGWVDATHMVVNTNKSDVVNFITTSITSNYPDELSVENDFPSFITSPLGDESNGFNILSVEPEKPILNLTLTLSRSVISSDDYALLNLTIINPTSYYIPLSYQLLTTNGLELINSSEWRPVVVKPGVTNSYTIIKSLVKQHTLHPIIVYLPLSGELRTQLEVNPTIPKQSSLNELTTIINSNRVVNKSLIVTANLSSNATYSSEVLLKLFLRNNGNYPLTNLTINVYSSLINNTGAVINSLGINEARNLTIPLIITARGNDSVRVLTTYDDNLVINNLVLSSRSKPVINLLFEGNNTFTDKASFVIRVNNPLLMSIYNASITIITPRTSVAKGFSINKAVNYEINTELPIDYFDFGENKVKLRINYLDEYGTEFSDELTVKIYRQGTMIDKLIDWFNQLINKISTLIN